VGKEKCRLSWGTAKNSGGIDGRLLGSLSRRVTEMFRKKGKGRKGGNVEGTRGITNGGGMATLSNKGQGWPAKNYIIRWGKCEEGIDKGGL